MISCCCCCSVERRCAGGAANNNTGPRNVCRQPLQGRRAALSSPGYAHNAPRK